MVGELYLFLTILGDGGGRIFLEDPTPINPRRENISRKDNPSLRPVWLSEKNLLCDKNGQPIENAILYKISLSTQVAHMKY